MIVLDASALVDVLVRSPRRPWVLDRLRSRPVCTPSHQPAEVLSALGRLTRAGEVSGDDVPGLLNDAMELNAELIPITKGHLQRAWVLRAGIRVVDGLYVALAEERSCPLLTTDRKLARNVTTCEVLVPPA